MAKRLSKKEFAKQKQTEMKETINKAMGDVAWHMKSEEGVKEYLDFMARMHDYSPRNQMLLKNQYKGAHGVAGKKHFDEMGFNIREGEKPLQVLAPVFKKYTIDKDDKWIPLNRPTKEQQAKIDSGEYKVKQKLHYYKFADVYDIGQTDAKAEDYPKIFPNRPFQFDEQALKEKYPDLKESMKKFAENQGFGLKEEQTTERLGNAKGAYYPFTNDIRMRPNLSDGEYISTLNHELAHGLLHKETTLDNPTKELEAEMTAYVTNKHFGLDTSEKSIDYMANWTDNLNKLDDKETFKVIERVSKASRSLIDGIEKEYEQVDEMEQRKNDIDIKSGKTQGIEQEHQVIIDNEKEMKEKTSDAIQTLNIGNMRFDYKNMKSDNLKEFTVLKDTDNLSVEFENGDTVEFYNNTADKRAFNKTYKTLQNDQESTIEDFVDFGLNKDDHNIEQVKDKETKKKNKKQDIEL